MSEDIGVDAVKVGMLGTREVALAVAQALGELPREVPVVVDPVMVAESGAVLLEADARHALVDAVLPRATVLTPNVLEARVLAGLEPDARSALADDEDAEVLALARAVLALGPDAVVVTGGHRARAVDVLLQAGADPVEGSNLVPAAPRTARAARTHPCSPPSSRSAQVCSTPHAVPA